MPHGWLAGHVPHGVHETVEVGGAEEYSGGHGVAVQVQIESKVRKRLITFRIQALTRTVNL